MTMTPAIKGQLTRRINLLKSSNEGQHSPFVLFINVRDVMAKHMPREQAKHAARKYLAQVAA